MYIRSRRIYSNKSKKADSKKEVKSSKNEVVAEEFLDSDRLVPVKDITSGYIRSSKPCCIISSEYREDITGGWEEVIITLLNMLYMKDNEKFRQNLLDYDITSMDLCVDTEYGKYSLEGKYKFKSYNIYNTRYHLELKPVPEVMAKSIRNLVLANGYELNDINIQLKAKYPDMEGYVIKDINSGIDIIEKGEMHLEKLLVLQEQFNVHRIDIALVVLAKWVTQDSGWDSLKNTPLTDRLCGTFISDVPVLERFAELSNGMVLNTDLSAHGIKMFFNRVSEGFKLEDEIMFVFRKDKKPEELKEWEL